MLNLSVFFVCVLSGCMLSVIVSVLGETDNFHFLYSRKKSLDDIFL